MVYGAPGWWVAGGVWDGRRCPAEAPAAGHVLMYDYKHGCVIVCGAGGWHWDASPSS